MTKPHIGPRMRRVLNSMTPISSAQAEANLERTLARVCPDEPRPGRPRNGERRPTVIKSFRVPANVEARAKQKARRTRTDPTKMARKLYTKWALS